MGRGMTRIDPPLYLASTTITCWRCGSRMPAVAIIAPNVPGTEGTVCILSETQSLPGNIRAFIQKRFPSYKLSYSKTIRSKYYANTCPRCGVLSGDFFLHSEPGAPFFPISAEDAAHLSLVEIPADSPIDVQAGLGMGPGEIILQHARKGK